MNFKSWLEMSYSDEDIPEKFYVVIQFDQKYNPEGIEQLAQGVLTGVTGVSSTPEIIDQWLGVAREAAIIMDSTAFMQLNPVTKIGYDNPEYLVSKNFNALRRIFNSTDERHLKHNLIEYLVRAAGKSNVQSIRPDGSWTIASAVLSDGQWSGLYWLEKRSLTMPSVNSTWDYARWLDQQFRNPDNKSAYHYKKVTYNIQDIHDLVISSLMLIGEIYKTEGEWILKNKVLRIPKDSELIVIVPKTKIEDWELAFGRSDLSSNHYAVKFAKQRIEKADEIVRVIQNLKLDEKYRLKMVEADGTYWSLQKIRQKPHWSPPDFWK